MSNDSILDQLGITTLKDEQLKQKLIDHGVTPGPILSSTRYIYQKRLAVLQGATLVDSSFTQEVETDEYEENSISQTSVTVRKSPRKPIRTNQPEKLVSPSTSKSDIRQRVVSPTSPPYGCQLTTAEQHSLSFDPELHAPSPRPSLRPTSRLSTSYLSESLKEPAPTTCDESGDNNGNSWMRLLVKFIVILILVIIVAFVYRYYYNDSPLENIQKIARQVVDSTQTKSILP